MTSIPPVAKALRTVLTRVANRAARTTHCGQRRSKLSGAKFVQTRVFGWLANPPAATSEELAQTAATLGVRISPQGREPRLTAVAAQGVERVLQAAVPQVITAAPVAIPLLPRFTAVYVDDRTQVPLPAVWAAGWAGSGGGAQATDQTAALKLQVRLDRKRGGLKGPFLQAGRASDRTSPTQPAPLPAGSLRLADWGYFALAVLQTLAQQQAYWLTRLLAGTQVYAAHGQALDLVAGWARYGTAVVDLPVRVGVHPRLPCRLMAVRVPQAVAAQRRRELHAAGAPARPSGEPSPLALGRLDPVLHQRAHRPLERPGSAGGGAGALAERIGVQAVEKLGPPRPLAPRPALARAV